MRPGQKKGAEMDRTEREARRRRSAEAARFYGDPTAAMTVFGVTGTNGKTTVSYLLKSILEQDGRPCGLLGTVQYAWGSESRRAALTTPDARELQGYFAEMRRQGIERCVMEVSSHGLEMERVAHVAFDYSIFTNLSRDHLDFHRDTEAYYQAKKRLFTMTAKTVIINIDDEYGKRLHNELSGSKIETSACSMEERTAAYFGEKAGNSAEAGFLLWRGGRKLGRIDCRLPGVYNCYNAMEAAACAMEAGVPFETAAAGIAAVERIPGRFEPVENRRGIRLYVDFAHTPDALEKLLTAAAAFTEGKLICVFGCGGDRDRSKRREMGRIAGTYSGFCVLTDDNPRTEDPARITAEVEAGLSETGAAWRVVHDRKEAIALAIGAWRPGDTVLIAGKGHEEYQIIGKSRQPFSDRQTAAELMDDNS